VIKNKVFHTFIAFLFGINLGNSLKIPSEGAEKPWFYITLTVASILITIVALVSNSK
jgi:hypothetical protein